MKFLFRVARCPPQYLEVFVIDSSFKNMTLTCHHFAFINILHVRVYPAAPKPRPIKLLRNHILDVLVAMQIQSPKCTKC